MSASGEGSGLNAMAAADGGIRGIHHIELYVTNSHQAAYFYGSVLGFAMVGSRRWSAAPDDDRTSVVMHRGDMVLVLTAPMTAVSAVAEHIRVHGEGVKDVALSVDDAAACHRRAIAAGAVAVRPVATQDVRGPQECGAVAICGDLVHSLVESSGDPVASWVGVMPPPLGVQVRDTRLESLDHVAVSLPRGDLDRCCEQYQAAFGFVRTHAEDVDTGASAMRSKVVQSPNGRVRLSLMESAAGRSTSQIEEYIQHHAGPGVQHLAFRSGSIVESVSAMAGGIEFLSTPASYYEVLEARVGDLSSEFAALRQHGVLVDRDATGLLLQVFSKPIGTRPTLFVEIIERRGAVGFGSGNIKALFAAVERAQAAQLAL